MAQAPRVPGPDHPISITPTSSRVTVRTGSKTIAETTRALTLQEASYPAVQYIPRADVDMSALTRTDRGSHCPYKGDACYFSIPAAGARGTNAVWSYEEPYPAMAAIKDHLAFYPDKVEITATPAG